jgi:hypothetical protein
MTLKQAEKETVMMTSVKAVKSPPRIAPSELGAEYRRVFNTVMGLMGHSIEGDPNGAMVARNSPDYPLAQRIAARVVGAGGTAEDYREAFYAVGSSMGLSLKNDPNGFTWAKNRGQLRAVAETTAMLFNPGSF